MSVLINMAVKLLVWVFFLLLNFMIYLAFGLLITRPQAGKERPGFTILAGFFLYYSLFTLFAVPVMYRWRPLSMLALIWGCVTVPVVVFSLIRGRRRLKGMALSFRDILKSNPAFVIGAFILVFIELLVVLYSYQFTLDAAYYVANVTTSVQTNSLNIYNPYTGDWQDHFEMRYFFATYALQDAVMCKWFSLPALIQTKIVMASVVIIMTNMLYYMMATGLLSGIAPAQDKYGWLPLLTMFFAGLINFWFTTIYTTSAFLLTRTYEGKSILANIVLPGILYIFVRMRSSEPEERGLWPVLFVIAFGSTVISNTSNMLVPAALMVLFVPEIIRKLIGRNVAGAFKEAGLTLLCMLPGIVLSLVYVAYVKGMFVFYTYPR